jgi:hypothetical protein
MARSGQVSQVEIKMTKKKIAYSLIALGAVVLVALLVVQFLSKSVFRQLTNGRLEGADIAPSTTPAARPGTV